MTSSHSDECSASSQAPSREEALRAASAEAQDSVDRLVREIDVILHGEEGAAPQASLCDLVGPIRALQARYDKLSSLVFNEVLPALKATGVNVSLVDDLRSAISPGTPS